MYNLGGAATAARYKVDIFFFMPAELEPRDSTGWFYLSLYSVVRLHTPRVPLSSLSSRGGAGALLDPERPETVLVVVAPPSAARALAGAALGGGVPPADRLYSVVTLREWEGGGDGAEDAAAPGWRDLLES